MQRKEIHRGVWTFSTKPYAFVGFCAVAALVASAFTAFAAEMPSSATMTVKPTGPPIGMGMYPAALPSHKTFQGAAGEREGGAEPASCCKTPCTEKAEACPMHTGKECTPATHEKAMKNEKAEACPMHSGKECAPAMHEKAMKHEKAQKADTAKPAEGGAVESQGASGEKEGMGSQGEAPVKPMKSRYNPNAQLYDLQTIGDWLSP